MKKHLRIAAFILACLLALGTVGCATDTDADPSENGNVPWDGERKDGEEYVPDGAQYTPRTDTVSYRFDVTSDPFAAAQMSFAIDLFKGTVARNDYDASTLISPLSISMALSMAANGAEGETLDQMLSVVAKDLTQEQLNEGMKALQERTLNNMKNTERAPKVNIANSLWLRESDAVSFQDEFLEANENYYAADAFERAFDKDTVKEINDWVSDRTDGMIPAVIDSLDERDVMVLINTLMFQAKWEDQFGEKSIKDGTFTTADGTEKDVKMLHGTEYDYVDDGRAQGFIKFYEGGRYAFVALLPDAGLTVADYVAGMDADTILSMLRDRETTRGIWCRYQLPEFSIDYNDGGRLDDVLKSLGMTDAYSQEKADFGGIGEMAEDGNNIHLRRIIHKTTMNVDENGTSAAAVTAIAAPGSPMPIEIRQLTFDRPFVCMIIETGTGIPLFIGTVMDVK